MSPLKLVAACAFAAWSAAALSSVVVIGAGDARMCYRTAESALTPTTHEMRFCDEALKGEALSRDDRVATLVNRGILLVRRGQIDAAIADFDAAIALNPNQGEAWHNKGVALMRRQDAGEALRHFTLALEHSTSRPARALFGRASAHEALGDLNRAYADFRRASEIEPRWPAPREELRRFRVVRR